jgi:hypothetical protein
MHRKKRDFLVKKYIVEVLCCFNSLIIKLPSYLFLEIGLNLRRIIFSVIFFLYYQTSWCVNPNIFFCYTLNNILSWFRLFYPDQRCRWQFFFWPDPPTRPVHDRTRPVSRVEQFFFWPAGQPVDSSVSNPSRVTRGSTRGSIQILLTKYFMLNILV